MSQVSKEQIEYARSIGIVEFFQNYYPEEMVRNGNTGYMGKTHDSFKFSEKGWYWHSQRFGGFSALDYLIKVEKIEFTEAVKLLCNGKFAPSEIETAKRYTENRKLILPALNDNCRTATKYLRSRGISKSVIDYCISKGTILETEKYHNVIFTGYDYLDEMKYAQYRSCNKARIMGECSGSDKKWSFRLDKTGAEEVHIFESAIDLLSYATLLEMSNKDFREYNMLSLGGISASNSDKIPASILSYIQTNNNTRTIYLHLDNDEPGRNAANNLIELLKPFYTVIDKPAPCGKDINDFLLSEIKKKGVNYER